MRGRLSGFEDFRVAPAANQRPRPDLGAFLNRFTSSGTVDGSTIPFGGDRTYLHRVRKTRPLRRHRLPRDGLRDREQPFRLLHVQLFDQAAVDHDNTLTRSLRAAPRSNYLAGFSDLLRRRAERSVGCLDLLRVNEGLPVEAHVTSLRAGKCQPGVIFKVEMHSVEGAKAIGTGSQHHK